MPPQNLFPAQWMHATKEVREYLAAMWKLPRSGVTEIRDQDVLSDGYTLDDLRGITLEKMNEYIGSEETFARAWEIAQAKAYSEMHPPVGEIKSTEEVRTVSDEDVAIPTPPPTVEEFPIPTETPVEPTPVKSPFDISDEKKSE